MKKRELVLDEESYVNYLLVAFRAVDTGIVKCFEAHDGQALTVEDRKTIRQILATYRVVTFNGRNYDVPILRCALQGATTNQIKAIGDRIIVQGLKPWELERELDLPYLDIDHVDVMEVAPGMGSLKVYAGRLHSKRLQDLPIEPNAVLTAEQKVLIRDYCTNSDCPATIDLRNALAKQIELREQMSAEYGEDLRSKSDAQVAEAVIKSLVQKRIGQKLQRPVVPPGSVFRYRRPEWMAFRTPMMRETLDKVLAAQFVVAASGSVEMPPELDGLAIPIGRSVYRMGIGGLHSSEQRVAHHADDDTILTDVDATSYYPFIILNNNLAPSHLGEHFLAVYRGIVQRRIDAKRSGNTVVANSLKITINGSFGKLGSMWSCLYSPDLLIQTTVTGQLALLMLIEAIEADGPLWGMEVVSANTDGIVIKCQRDAYGRLLDHVKTWEAVTSFETEETRYRALYSRDVNNYVALKEGGGTKTKGAYATEGLQKNPAANICVEAVCEFLDKGVPVERTVLGCTDVRKFLTLRTVKGGGVWGAKQLFRDEHYLTPGGKARVKQVFAGIEGGQYLGKTVRWYYSVNSESDIRYRGNGNKVPRTENCMPMMELADAVPWDLDRDWYIKEARAILCDIGHKESACI